MPFTADHNITNVGWNTQHITSSVVVKKNGKYINTTNNVIILDTFQIDEGEVFAIINSGGGKIDLTNNTFIVNNNATAIYELDEQNVCMIFAKTDTNGAFHPVSECISSSALHPNFWFTETITLTTQQIIDRQITLSEIPIDQNTVFMDILHGGNSIVNTDFFVVGQTLHWHNTELETVFSIGDTFQVKYIKV